MPRLRIATFNRVGNVTKLVLSIATCLAVVACSTAPINNSSGSSGSQQEEDPWVETFVQQGYRWNGTYEGVTSEIETTYETDKNRVTGVYREVRGYNTEHSHTNMATAYWRYWSRDVYGNYAKGECGSVEEDGSRSVEQDLSFVHEYDDRGRIIKTTTTSINSDGSTDIYVDEFEYDADGGYNITSTVNGESVLSDEDSVESEDGEEIVRSNSYGDKLYYKTNDDGILCLTDIEICDEDGRVIYVIDSFPPTFDTELSDISGCAFTGYAYDERNNVIERLSYDDEFTTIEHNVYANNGHIVYNTLYFDYPAENSADIKTYQYTNIKTGEKTELLDPGDVRVQTTPVLVEPLSDYLAQR